MLSCARHSLGLCVSVAVALLVGQAAAQGGRPPEPPKPKPAAEKAADADAARYCANVGPSIAEARIAWQTKRLAELDAQLRQRIADVEKAEASAREWIAKRDALMKAASDEIVAIYGRMQPESAARQLGAMDEKLAAAILARLKPGVASAILDEMEADRASRLAGLVAAREDKKS
ncbi:MAG TPA: hypothetical protein VMI72_14145 [Roseiarcus sp.]|nr:hypothetical protein [Roseiarcus sp.]